MEPQICAECFWTMDRQWNIDVMKLLNKKLTRLAVSSRLTESGQMVVHTVTQCVYACQHQQS